MKTTTLTIQLASTGFQRFLVFNQFEIEVRDGRVFCYLWLLNGTAIEDVFAVSISKRDALEEKNKIKKYLEKLRTNPSSSVVCQDYVFEKPAGIEFPPPTVARTISCARSGDDTEIAFHFYSLGARNFAAEQDGTSLESCPIAIAVSNLQNHVDFLHLLVRATEALSN